MKDVHGNVWKHATQVHPLAKNEVTHTAVFDDEAPGMVVIYRTDGKRFSPCRSVDTGSREHFDTVLAAWGAEFPFLDLRRDRSIPLPALTAVR
jgi:hypothetical protein